MKIETDPELKFVKQLDYLIVSGDEVNKSYIGKHILDSKRTNKSLPYLISLKRDYYNTYRLYVLCQSCVSA
jgi:hypothetical protein